MKNCRYCKSFFECAQDAELNGHEFNPEFNGEAHCPSFKMGTNADRIRSMSDQELADFLEGDYGNMMTGRALAWLQEPAGG